MRTEEQNALLAVPEKGCCNYDCTKITFGALPPLPDGYSVWWHGSHEHYQAHGPDDWESAITVNRFHARHWCFQHAKEQELTPNEN